MNNTALRPTAATPIQSEANLYGSWDFTAMNTRVQFFSHDLPVPSLFRDAQRAFIEAEERFSRFLPSSELALLNKRAGSEVVVSREMFELLTLCVRYHDLSERLFDPAILPVLESAGYDRSFEFVVSTDGHGPKRYPEAGPRSIADLVLDADGPAVRAPKGLQLDLGGIAKGATVDRARAVLAPMEHFLIDAGGDIYASGDGPDGSGWLVSVARPFREDEDLTLVRLRNQAIATSTTSRRRWQRAGQWMHHLIDPRTAKPADSGVVSVSTIAATAVEADVFAKVALLLGLAEGKQFLAAQRAHGLFVRSDGSWETTEHWPGGYS